MASKSIYCAFVILACVVLASLPSQVRADNPPPTKTACKDAKVPEDFEIKQLDGEWYEIQRRKSANSFDSGFQCIKLKFASETNVTGKVFISMSQENNKKLEKDTINTTFSVIEDRSIQFKVNNVTLNIKILAKPSAFIVSCGSTVGSTDPAQAWIFSKTRELKDAEKKGAQDFIKNFSDFDSLEDVEQNEKKCNGAGSIVPVISVLALTLFTVLKGF